MNLKASVRQWIPLQSRRDEEEFDRVLKENQEKDTLLSQKQDEINKAYSQAAENRKEVEMLKEENDPAEERGVHSDGETEV